MNEEKIVESLEQFFTRMTEKQQRIQDVHQGLENLKAEYRGEIKARFGITDGESLNVLDFMKAVHGVLGLG